MSVEEKLHVGQIVVITELKKSRGVGGPATAESPQARPRHAVEGGPENLVPDPSDVQHHRLAAVVSTASARVLTRGPAGPPGSVVGRE